MENLTNERLIEAQIQDLIALVRRPRESLSEPTVRHWSRADPVHGTWLSETGTSDSGGV